jgi:hypothetical protein
MPAKPQGVYSDGHGGSYIKVTVGQDNLTGRRVQVTRRGFRTAAEAARARRELLDHVGTGRLKPSAAGTTVNELQRFDSARRLRRSGRSGQALFDVLSRSDQVLDVLLIVRSILRSITQEPGSTIG